MLKSGIYAIVNILTDKIYVGSSIYIKDRWHLHRKQLRLNKHHSKHLQASWNKYGEQNFIFTVIEYCTRDYLLEREQFWMDNLDCAYNTQLTAGSPLGYKHSEEAKAKMRLREISIEHKNKVSEANKNRVGVKYNVERKHTWNKCKCEQCRLRFIEYKRKWRAKKKLENPELYAEQIRKYRPINKNRILPFTIVNNASVG